MRLPCVFYELCVGMYVSTAWVSLTADNGVWLLLLAWI